MDRFESGDSVRIVVCDVPGTGLSHAARDETMLGYEGSGTVGKVAYYDQGRAHYNVRYNEGEEAVISGTSLEAVVVPEEWLHPGDYLIQEMEPT